MLEKRRNISGRKKRLNGKESGGGRGVDEDEVRKKKIEIESPDER